ncbi:hypothetical protein FPL11_09125 [Spiribacter aquaticus]|jgi:hypothetical protein|uniref:Uncharacterized protein n=1 Tax=Spiribacter aquaticus TaxID=1935996 RepID=A0A557RF82_9GAMM|nr:hypothetical protein FPL11_09125 [Spiribacter aquaticus]
MRRRTKTCAECDRPGDVLYRCRYGAGSDWVFVCGACLKTIKPMHPDSYQYGGTWKSRKR